MKPVKLLPNNLTHNGFEYTFVRRGHRSLIYEQKVCEISSNFEVWNKIILLGKERFPEDEDFGTIAWTFNDFESAENRFNLLENNELIKPLTYYDEL